MLKLILGRAKSGKTAAIMDAVRFRVLQGLDRTVLLIPEQYSHEAETELLRVCGDRLCLYAEVLSFTRLAARVDAEEGFSARGALDKGGRLLCLVRAVDAVGSRLRVCGAARRQPELQQRLRAAGCPATVVEPFVTGVTQLETMVRLGYSNHMPEAAVAMERLNWYERT